MFSQTSNGLSFVRILIKGFRYELLSLDWQLFWYLEVTLSLNIILPAWYFSWFISWKYYRKAPYQQSFRRLELRWPKYQRMYRSCPLKGFTGKHNLKFRSRFFVLKMSIQPIQNRIIYKHPLIKNKSTQVMTMF